MEVSLSPTRCMVELYGPTPMGPNALYQLRENIKSLLYGRKESQVALAFSLGKTKSWINKFLNGQREIQLKDLDRIADFFGIATYQLFQPGVSRLTERRSGFDRRSQKDRRISHETRLARDLEQRVRPRGTTEAASPADSALRALIADFERRATRLLSQTDAGRQAATARPRTARKTPRRRVAGG